MAKNNVADLDTTAANNSDFAGTDSTGTTGLVKNGDNILRTIGSMLKKWWNDLGAQVTVGGTANAITITSSSTYQSLASGIRILFKPSADNSGATTLNLDSLGVKAVRKISGGTDVALTAKDLLNGKRAELVYDSSANAAAGAWILLNAQGDQLNLPSDGVINWANGNVTITQSTGLLTTNANLTISKTSPLIDFNASASGQSAGIEMLTASSVRWQIVKGFGSESGSNAGSDLTFAAYSDAGSFLGNYLVISRATGLVTITGSLSRAAPVTKTGDFTVAANETWLINNKAGSSCTVTLPSASANPGREITIKNLQAQTVISASSNVVPRTTAVAGTAILSASAGQWATLVSDGTNWVIMAGS